MTRALETLDAVAAERLVKLCGMFGSWHPGERDNAAVLADRLVRQLGLTWGQIIVPRLLAPEPEQRPIWREPRTSREAIGLAIQYADILTDWERRFVFSLRDTIRPSPKQVTVLDQIVDKVRDAFMQEPA